MDRCQNEDLFVGFLEQSISRHVQKRNKVLPAKFEPLAVCARYRPPQPSGRIADIAQDIEKNFRHVIRLVDQIVFT